MRRRVLCCAASACRSRHPRRGWKGPSPTHGDEEPDPQVPADAEVQGAGLPPLPDLRPSAWLHAQIRAVPDLLPRPRADGRAARRDEVELVTEMKRATSGFAVRSETTSHERVSSAQP